MEQLNELFKLAKLAKIAGQGSPEMVDFRVMANPDNILAIAEAFREIGAKAVEDFASEQKLIADSSHDDYHRFARAAQCRAEFFATKIRLGDVS